MEAEYELHGIRSCVMSMPHVKANNGMARKAEPDERKFYED